MNATKQDIKTNITKIAVSAGRDDVVGWHDLSGKDCHGKRVGNVSERLVFVDNNRYAVGTITIGDMSTSLGAVSTEQLTGFDLDKHKAMVSQLSNESIAESEQRLASVVELLCSLSPIAVKQNYRITINDSLIELVFYYADYCVSVMTDYKKETPSLEYIGEWFEYYLGDSHGDGVDIMVLAGNEWVKLLNFYHIADTTIFDQHYPVKAFLPVVVAATPSNQLVTGEQLARVLESIRDHYVGLEFVSFAIRNFGSKAQPVIRAQNQYRNAKYLINVY